MKTKLFALLSLAFITILPLHAAHSAKNLSKLNLPPEKGKWLSPLVDKWERHFDEALKEAQKDEKYILVINFDRDDKTGCKKLKSDVFDSQDFVFLRQRAFIVLYLEKPTHKRLKEDQLQHDAAVRKLLGISDTVFPTLTILTSKGKRLDSLEGFSSQEETMKFLRQYDIPKKRKQAILPYTQQQ